MDEGEGAFGGVLVRREGGEEEDLQAVEASGLLGKGVKKSRRSKKGAEPGPQLDKVGGAVLMERGEGRRVEVEGGKGAGC